MNDELAEILNEADYMKEKEVRFHRKAERINVAAVWWPVLQIGILVLTAVLQVHEKPYLAYTGNPSDAHPTRVIP